MIREICTNKDKGIKWEMVVYMNCFPIHHTGGTEFHLLPAISYNRFTEYEFGDDHHFDISFKWLFWEISISRYWGDVYKR